MMDDDSGDDGSGRDKLRQLGWDEWEEEWSGWGWRNEAGRLFHIGKEMHNEMSDLWFLKKMMVVKRW